MNHITTLSFKFVLQTQRQMAVVIYSLLFLIAIQIETPLPFQDLCQPIQSKRYVDISSARIEKVQTFEYSLLLYDSPAEIVRNKTQLIFKGNFSKLIIKNYAKQKQFVYYGTQIIFKIPADHVFNLEKIPDLEIQIIHTISELTHENPYNFVMLSQLYVISKFTNKIQTVLGKYFNKASKSGDLIQTSKIVKMMDGFPLLMYKGSADTFPCRSDLICLIKRQYQLISQQDFNELQQLFAIRGAKNNKKISKRKSIYLIQPINKKNIQYNNQL